METSWLLSSQVIFSFLISHLSSLISYPIFSLKNLINDKTIKKKKSSQNFPFVGLKSVHNGHNAPIHELGFFSIIFFVHNSEECWSLL